MCSCILDREYRCVGKRCIVTSINKSPSSVCPGSVKPSTREMSRNTYRKSFVAKCEMQPTLTAVATLFSSFTTFALKTKRNFPLTTSIKH